MSLSSVLQGAASICGADSPLIIDKNPIAAAAGFAQFSGLLAGFVFAGTLILFDRARSDFINLRTLSLFYTGFIVLGVDGYLFYAIAGSESAGVVGGRQISTEYIIAGGLLAMGSLLIISGIGWLIRDCTGNQARRIVRQMPYGVAVVVAFMLSLAVLDYLISWFAGCPPAWLIWLTVLYPVLVLTVIIGIKIAEPAIAKKADADAEGDWPRIVLRYGTYISGFFAIAVSMLSGSLVLTPLGWWDRPSASLGVVISLVVLVMPAAPLVALFTTVPPARAIRVKVPRQRSGPEQLERKDGERLAGEGEGVRRSAPRDAERRSAPMEGDPRSSPRDADRESGRDGE